MAGLAWDRVTAGIATLLFPCASWQGWISKLVQGPFAPCRGSERTCQNPSWWGWINILCIINTNSAYKPKRQLPSCAAPVTCTSKGAAQLLSAVNFFFVCPVPIITKLQSQGTFLPLRIMGVLTLKNNVASAGVKLLAGLTCCSV